MWINMQTGYKVLIVDDVPDNIQVAMNVLREENVDLAFATSGKEALELIENGDFDLVLLDIMMPGMDGLETCERLRRTEKGKDLPVIFVTAKTDVDSIAKGFSVGGVDYITKPFHPEELIARVRTHLELYRAKALLEYHNISLERKLEFSEKRLLGEIEANQREMIFFLTELMEATSDETGRHLRRVAEYSRLLAHYHHSIAEEDANLIFQASPMHDIGKIAVPEEILHKPGKLTPDEYNIMKTHTTKAYEFFHSSSRRIMEAASIIAYQHHEKWDGSGYPRGLKGNDIHIYGRIVALADVFDALTHKRVYKEPWSIEDAVEYIVDNSAKHFDPYLVEIFQENLDEFIAISKF